MAAAISLDAKTFVGHTLILKVETKVLVDLLEEITILAVYSNYIDVFLSKLITKLLKHNNTAYIIELKKVISYFIAQLTILN